MNQIFDLFGDPVPSNWGQRGRPEHVPTQQNRNRVSMLVAAGWSNVRIAAALYITVPTLRKHYFSELHFRAVARDRLTANMLTKLWALFMDGNVAATPIRVGKKVIDEQRAKDADADLMAELETEAAQQQNAVH
jgi:hypothetical protein